MRGLIATLLILCLLGTASCDQNGPPTPRPRQEIMVFAAASLRDALQAVGQKFELNHPKIKLIFNFAGSNTLARQLLARPYANIFISANEMWMDRLEAAGRLAPGSRRNVVSNRLAFIAATRSAFVWPGPTKLTSLDYRYLVIGDPDAVPAGIYARRYLESLKVDGSSVWFEVQDRLLPMPDVRATLRAVERNPKSVGIVYETDALMSPRVRTLYAVPPDEGPAIRYPAALIKDEDSAPAKAFLDFLSSDRAQDMFRRFGFVTQPSAPKDGSLRPGPSQ